MSDLDKRHQDVLLKLGSVGARSWLSRQILERGADVGTAFGVLGFERAESAITSATGRLLAWSIRRDRRAHRSK